LRHFLFIDNGNTATKGLLTDEFYRPVYHFTTVPDGFSAEKKQLFSFGEISGGYYASVGKLDETLRNDFENALLLKPFNAQTHIPLKMGYETPETLGADRLATAIGGFSLYPDTDLLVLDFGTCLKFDFVSKERKYEGGSISPGLNMRFKSMHTFTAKLPLLSMPEKFPAQPIGRSTADSMQHGVLLGILAEADGMIGFYRQTYPDLRVLVTGGDAEVFEGRLKNAIFVRQNLALLGLAETMKYNANTPNDK
jgi:type III pantothenate kinase